MQVYNSTNAPVCKQAVTEASARQIDEDIALIREIQSRYTDAEADAVFAALGHALQKLRRLQEARAILIKPQPESKGRVGSIEI
jgi:hypothetical protein